MPRAAALLVRRMMSPVLVASVVAAASGGSSAQAPPARPAASQPDAYASRTRVFVLTDIANEPDDQMSLVRFLVYANHFDVEGLVATTSTWLKTGARPDVLQSVVAAYAHVQPALARHEPGFPTADDLRARIAAGQPAYGMAAVGTGRSTPGSAALLAAARRDDPRPLWISVWGGANTLAQALVDAQSQLSPADLEAVVSRLRVYAISDQDDAGAWLRREFPSLHYVVSPSTQNGEEYASATWTGISGDRFYRNAPGADFTTFTDAWVNVNVRGRGPLGKMYPYPCCIHEGDTPSFLGLVDNGLASAVSPAYGGWGGRYVWRQPSGESRPIWTQGGDAYPGRDSSRDTVTGADGQSYTSDQASIWRWRTAFQHDFAARMAWTVLAPEAANHNPRVVVNGTDGKAPVEIQAVVGAPVALDAAGTSDPDGHTLEYRWWFYAEAGMGIPGHPVVSRGRRGDAPPATTQPESPPAARGVREGPRVRLEQATMPRATVVPLIAGAAHVILEVTDNGTPRLTSYRRVIIRAREP